MKCKEESYTRLFQVIEQCVTETTYKQIAKCKKMLVIAINIETRFKNCVEALEKENEDIQLIIVAQPALAHVLQKEYAGKYEVISWEGRYTMGILDKVSENGGMDDVDGFLFFSEQGINLRDLNFLSIAERMQETRETAVFSNTIGNDLYEYKNVQLYKQALQLYQDINKLIDLYLTKRPE